jgi:hypothetical protein
MHGSTCVKLQLYNKVLFQGHGGLMIGKWSCHQPVARSRLEWLFYSSCRTGHPQELAPHLSALLPDGTEISKTVHINRKHSSALLNVVFIKEALQLVLRKNHEMKTF